MSKRYGSLPDPSGGSYNQGGHRQQQMDDDEEEDERSYPLFKAFENYVRRTFENQTTNTSVHGISYDECAAGISVTLGAVQKADRTFRNMIEGFPGSPEVAYDSDFDETQNRDVHSVFVAWPPYKMGGMGKIFSAPSKRGVKFYDQPRTIILAMLTTLLVSALSTTGEQWILLGTKVGLL